MSSKEQICKNCDCKGTCTCECGTTCKCVENCTCGKSNKETTTSTKPGIKETEHGQSSGKPKACGNEACTCSDCKCKPSECTCGKK
ncbi:6401_t:CDS:2 [Funneliformis geosporum]|uniref:8746_t:CDS:1 n=1 Tax=Funneliformis geosporum TaxID=1117311 RepID=A0A9W4SHQ9_9GLOM|nr:8746_t:CDS:2 [Funneliformis geosporum]CAI2186226.1 6401_t:CDS:2 [Funneliformis geosporum]